MQIGYARVSTQEQTLDLQLDSLQQAGCEKVFTDHASGAKSARPGLQEALDFIRPGDVLVVWRLDRLARSLPHLIDILRGLQARGIDFKCLNQQIDTTTPTGKLIFHVSGAFAEFERDLIRERTLAGLRAARARGRVGGRPKALDPKKVGLLQRLYSDPQNDISEICRTLRIGRTTLYRYVSPGTRALRK
jgi:DNA invertase Pin-like site-specific DNA recombinase